MMPLQNVRTFYFQAPWLLNRVTAYQREVDRISFGRLLASIFYMISSPGIAESPVATMHLKSGISNIDQNNWDCRIS